MPPVGVEPTISVGERPALLLTTPCDLGLFDYPDILVLIKWK
jgi:hypothetical protein